MAILGDILSLMIIFAVPLLLVAMGGMFSERSGTINIALEGIMIIGALGGCLLLRAFDAGSLSQSAPQLCVLIAILFSGLCGAIYSLLLAFAAIHLKADQTIGGTALNILAPAVAIIVTWAIQGQGQTIIRIPAWVPMAKIGEDAGFLARVFLKDSYLTTIVAAVLFVVGTILLYKTKFGLRLRACGEHPQAADSVGINVYKMRYIGVVISGFLAGIGGLSFVMAAGTGFNSDVAGYGFLALAVMIFGNWQPLRILGAAFLFAFFKSLSGMATSIPWMPTFSNLRESNYIYLMIPYFVTMIVLAFTSKKSRAPKAEGVPYDKSGR